MAGEGRLLERRRSPLSDLTSPYQTNKYRIQKINQFERGFTLKVLPEGNKGVSVKINHMQTKLFY
jgi:hypothetical protein